MSIQQEVRERIQATVYYLQSEGVGFELVEAVKSLGSTIEAVAAAVPVSPAPGVCEAPIDWFPASWQHERGDFRCVVAAGYCGGPYGWSVWHRRRHLASGTGDTLEAACSAGVAAMNSQEAFHA